MLKTLLHYINIFGFLWTLCICMFHIAMPRWLLFGGMYMFVFTWLIEFVLDKRWQVKPMREWIHYLLLLVFFLWEFLYLPTEGSLYFHHHMEQRYPLLAFGIIGFFGINNRYSRSIVIHTMMLASVCSVLFLFTKTGWHTILFSPKRIFEYSYIRTLYINTHMMHDFFLNSTLVGIWYLLFHADRKPLLWQKIVYPLVVVIIFGGLLCSDGRSGFFMGLVIISTMTVVELFRHNKRLAIGICVASIGIVLALSALHPRISQQSIEYDLRYSYWKAAVELIKEKPIVGYGMNNAQEMFDQICPNYISANNSYYWQVRKEHFIDTHNQYLQTMLEYGIIGLILLLAIYLSPLWICWGSKRWWLAFFFTLLSLGQSIFDMFLTGQFNILYGILFLVTLRMTKDYSSPTPHSPSAASHEECID